MKIVKRIALATLLLLLLVAGSIVLLIGPWPLYTNSDFLTKGYYKRAISAIDSAAALTTVGGEIAPLRAGWARREITPEIGHPLAGYGGRKNDKRSEGRHETLYVQAVALSDGVDTVVLVGSDLIQTLPNLLEAVEPQIKAAVGLSNRNIMYTSSHTHGGPGGLAPGRVAEVAYGTYSAEYVAHLAGQIAGAIIEAVEKLAPARFAHGVVEVPEYIVNRARSGGAVDAALHFAVAERISDGARLHLARYSAHATVYGEEMMALNNDYAGAFQRVVEARTGAPLLFMSGAVGAMGPNPPGPPRPDAAAMGLALAFENDAESTLVRQGKKSLDDLLHDQAARAEAMGAALADRMLPAVAGLSWETEVDIATLAAPYTPPPAQVRLFSPRWRVSPYLFAVLGVPTEGRLQAARIGSLVLAGFPYDFGGDISHEWQAWARERGAALWVTSFSGAYLGYLSPDREYNNIGEGRHYNQNYEVVQMNWFGPDQEAYVEALFRHAFGRLMGVGTTN